MLPLHVEFQGAHVIPEADLKERRPTMTQEALISLLRENHILQEKTLQDMDSGPVAGFVQDGQKTIPFRITKTETHAIITFGRILKRRIKIPIKEIEPTL